jgi:hypothetical protein
MNALVRKEIRLLLPTWIAGLALVVLPGMIVEWLISHGLGLPSQYIGFLFLFFGLGALLLSLAAFGQELGAGTFSMMLAQPAERSCLWRAKVGTLGLAILSIWGAFIACTWVESGVGTGSSVLRHYIAGSVIIPAMAVSGALWTTILFRQVVSAFWFTLLIPFVICLALIPLGNRNYALFDWGAQILLVLYALGGFLWARHMFFRAQDVPWTGGTISLPTWLTRVNQAHSTSAIQKRRPIRALIRKEILSQHATLLLGGIFLVLHVATIGIRKLIYNPADEDKILYQILSSYPALWLVLPAIAGAVAVAEERRQGTLESQLCLPISRSWQWAIKLVITILAGITLGCLTPALLERAAVAVGVRSPIMEATGEQVELWVRLIEDGIVAGGITFVAFYASTLTHNVLQAISAAVIICLGLVALSAFTVWAWTVTGVVGGERGPLIIYVAATLLPGVLLYRSFLNCRLPSVGWNIWVRNLATILAAMWLIVGVTAFAYHRDWEYLMPLEPKHGQAILSGSVRPKICFAQYKAFALLPDGRLWASVDYQFQDTWAYQTLPRSDTKPEGHKRLLLAVPTNGVFLDGTNWVDVASSLFPLSGWPDPDQLRFAIPGADRMSNFGEVAGLKADGTLWRIYTANAGDSGAAPTPERFGTDSDWAAIAGSGTHFLALKRDGSLWGWGNNTFGQLGPGRKIRVNEPVRIGTNTDWVSVFVTGQASIGVKEDGSVWRWGYLVSKEKGWETAHPEPVRWAEGGRDWLEIGNGILGGVVLDKDGRIRRVRKLPGRAVGVDPSGHLPNVAPWAKYKSMSMQGDLVVLVESNGPLISRDVGPKGPYIAYPFREASRYSDWLTAHCSDWTGMFISLAADGTLSCWADPDGTQFDPPLLGPSRKPLWSVNILAKAAGK